MATETPSEASSSQTTCWTSSNVTYDHAACSARTPYTISDTWPIVAFATVTVVLCLIGNVLVLFIYNYRWRAVGATTTYVSYLAVSDLLSGLISVPNDLMLFTFVSARDPMLHLRFDVICKVSGYLAHGFRWSSAFLLLVIAVRRYLKVDKAFKLFSDELVSARPMTPAGTGRLYATINSERGAKLISFLAFSLAFILTVPAIFVYGNAPESSCFFKFSTCFSCYFYCGVSGALRESAVTRAFFAFASGAFALTAVPMIGLYAAVAWRVRASERKRKNLDCTSRQAPRGRTPQNTRLPARDSGTVAASARPSLHSSEEGGRDASAAACGPPAYFPPISYAAHFASIPRLPSVDDFDGSCVTEFANCSTTSFQVTKAGGRKARNTTFALMLISVAYVLTYLPYLSLSMLRRFGAGWCQSNEPMGVVVAAEMFRRTYLISSAVNPLVYGFCNPTFRKVLWKLLARRRDVI